MKRSNKIQSNPNDPRFERTGFGAGGHPNGDSPADRIKPRQNIAAEKRIAAELYKKAARILKDDFEFSPEELQKFTGAFFDD